MIQRRGGPIPRTHNLSELEDAYTKLYPDQSFIFDHPFDFGSYQACDLNESEQSLAEHHIEKFKPKYMDQHLRYPSDYRTGGYSFSFDSSLFDVLKRKMLSISGSSC